MKQLLDEVDIVEAHRQKESFEKSRKALNRVKSKNNGQTLPKHQKLIQHVQEKAKNISFLDYRHTAAKWKDIDYINALEIRYMIDWDEKNLAKIKKIIICQDYIEVAGVKLLRFDEKFKWDKILWTYADYMSNYSRNDYKVPHIDDWRYIFKNIPGNSHGEICVNFIEILNIPLVGYKEYKWEKHNDIWITWYYMANWESSSSSNSAQPFWFMDWIFNSFATVFGISKHEAKVHKNKLEKRDYCSLRLFKK